MSEPIIRRSPDRQRIVELEERERALEEALRDAATCPPVRSAWIVRRHCERLGVSLTPTKEVHGEH